MRGLAVLARDTCIRLEVSTVIEIGKFYVTDSPHRRRYWITSCYLALTLNITRIHLGDAFGKNDYPWAAVAEQEG
jgi:hypothetical protein